MEKAVRLFGDSNIEIRWFAKNRKPTNYAFYIALKIPAIYEHSIRCTAVTSLISRLPSRLTSVR